MGLPEPSVSRGLRETKRAQVRRSLQETALRLFARRGFSNVSVDEIATEANVSRSTFFRYFGSKEAVLLQDFDESGDIFLRHLHSRPSGETPLEAFENALLAGTRDAADREVLEHQKKVGDLLRSDPALKGRRLAEIERWSGVIAQAFAARAGRTEPNLDDRLASAISLAISEQVGDHLRENETVANAEEVIRQAFRVVETL